MSIQQRIYLKIFLVAAFIFAVATFLFPYMSRGIVAVSQNLDSRKDNFNSLSAKEIYLRDLRADYALAKDDIAFWRDSFLVDDAVIDFIREIEKISARTGNVEEIKITTPQIKKDGNLNFIGFQVFLYGDFNGLMDFLAELENGKYQTAVTELRIMKVDKNSTVYNQNQIVNIEAVDIRSILDVQAYVL